MNKFFRQLPLQAKLALIGIIPLVFLIYLSFQVYHEKTEKLHLLASYIDRMHESADIAALIDNLQTERKFSFEFTLKKDMYEELLRQRPKTDSVMKRLSAYKASLSDFPSYTFLDNLANMRKAVDSGHVNLTMVMDYYTNVIFRFNMLNTLSTGSDVYLEPVYRDLAAQKMLSEMVTFLGIMSANVYNSLYTRQYMIEILMGTRGVYLVYGTYEKEFLLKASPEAIASFKQLKSSSSLLPATNYLDKIFKNFAYDSTYDYIEWGKVSSSAIDELRNFQQNLLQGAIARVNLLYKNEQSLKQNILILLIIALSFVIALVVYIIRIITGMLNELKYASQKIAKGESGIQLNIHSHDAIGTLATAIASIDSNNKKLTEAADAIGNSQFNTSVEPRSEEDILGNAIMRMKNNLQQLFNDLKSAQAKIDGMNKNLEQLVAQRTTQLESANKELEAFSYSVSHDLRAPLRAISGYTMKLKEKYGQVLDAEATRLISIIVTNAKMMGQLIDDLIAFSTTGQKELAHQTVDMKNLAETCLAELQEHDKPAKYEIRIDDLPACQGDPNLLKQVWINLIGNAIKYSSKAEKPSIEISFADEGPCYVYCISDNGVGFDMQYYGKLFGVFQRLHTDEIYKGTGIGLALVKRIINKHRGDIKAKSAPGKGATFYFTIPK